MRTRQLLAVCLLLLTAGCTSGTVTGGEVTLEEASDLDCDGRFGGVTLRAAAAFRGSGDFFAAPEPYAELSYRGTGDWTTLRRFEDVSWDEFDRAVEVTSAGLDGTEGEVRFRLRLSENDLTDEEELGTVRSDPVDIEASDEDAVRLRPAFDWSPGRPAPGELVTFRGNESSGTQCALTYEWDLDGDGRIDATGREITHRFERDGYRTVRLHVVDSNGRTANASRAVLVFLGPDEDGVTNAVERRHDTDSNNPDTDDDLFDDGIDTIPTSLLVPTLLLQLLLTAGIAAALYAGRRL